MHPERYCGFCRTAVVLHLQQCINAVLRVVETVHFRLSPHLRKRVGLAAASADQQIAVYARRQVERWLSSDPRLPISELAEETPAPELRAYRLSISGTVRTRLRVAAAERDLAVGHLIARILHTFTPYPTELLLQTDSAGYFSGESHG